MENKISIIIPTYNSESTIKECLDSVFNSNFKDFDVILISDKSTDGTVEIAKKYNCQIIELSENKGPAYVRNLGAKNAKGDILFFIDSDVIIKRDALSILNDEFNKKKNNVIQGIYSHKPNYNTVTQFQQSFLCYYTWSKKIKYTDTLTSACFAIKKETFLHFKGFNTDIKSATCEDEEFGYTLIDNDNQILINRDLIVEHRINLSLLKFIKRNFIMNFKTMKSFLRNKNYFKKKVNQNNYSSVLSSVPLLGLILLTLVILPLYYSQTMIIIFLFLNIIFLILNLNFFYFVFIEKGLLKAIGIILTCYLNYFLIMTGASCAFISYIFGKKY